MFKKINSLIIDQIKTGMTPEKIAQSVVMGIIIGIIPYLGVSTILALFVATKMKLNQVLTQAVNYLIYPVQIIMIPIYIKAVGFIFQVGEAPVRPDLIYKQFVESPTAFMMKYGLIGLYSFFVWVPLSLFIYVILQPILLKLIVKIKMRHAIWNG